MFKKLDEKWLVANFGSYIEPKETENGIVYHAPNLYADRSWGKEEKLILLPFEIEEQDFEQACGAIAELVYDSAKKNCLNVFLPKAGQDASAIKLASPYDLIQSGDPRHVHGSPLLLDFSCVDTSFFLRRIRKGSLDNNRHFHLSVD